MSWESQTWKRKVGDMNQHELKQTCIRGFLKACEDMTRKGLWRGKETGNYSQIKAKQSNRILDIVCVHVGIEPTPLLPKKWRIRTNERKDEDGNDKRSETQSDGCIHSFSSERANSLRL